ncbi:energy transduction protein TonB [Campylobacter hyointestinalis subsp. hyointestinalis LMG 9260]|uniref:energy transducer TonB n=1 Tax=Campylobacter hyointestinalis TaxID=198 RepID=UPI0007C98F84|nr:energy transducer TonB [Campylobacter hyointestinalis]ANE33267.1 energy transduction protein TonB [Campylobacter hyointestinalis subsp. hyointestinalis LMG 9260]SUW89464.1 protein TonB [Campylobacter hyointestinalis]
MRYIRPYFNHKLQAFYITSLLFMPMIFAFIQFATTVKFEQQKSDEILLSIKQITLNKASSPSKLAVKPPEPIPEQVKPIQKIEEFKKPKKIKVAKPHHIKNKVKKPIVEKPIQKPTINEQNQAISAISTAQTNTQEPTTKTVEATEQMQTLSYGNSDDPFLKELKAAIDRAGIYPRIARKMRLEGEIWLEFIWTKNSKLEDLKITKKSSHDILDKSALETIIKASRNFPKHHKTIKIQVPIIYKIK